MTLLSKLQNTGYNYEEGEHINLIKNCNNISEIQNAINNYTNKTNKTSENHAILSHLKRRKKAVERRLVNNISLKRNNKLPNVEPNNLTNEHLQSLINQNRQRRMRKKFTNLSRNIKDENKTGGDPTCCGAIGGKKAKRKPAKRKPTGKKKVRKIHKGPRGGRYYISKGRKVYL